MKLDILGIGVGRLDVKLERVDLALGDTIRGTLTLQLTEPGDAKRLVVGVEASQRIITTHLDRDGIGYRKDKAWHFEKQLKGEGRYSKLTTRFTLKLPDTLEQSGQLPDSLLGDLVQAVSFLQPSKRFPLEWSVFAFLDRPWKVNVKARVPITVSVGGGAGRAASRPAPASASPTRPAPPRSTGSTGSTARPAGRKKAKSRRKWKRTSTATRS